MASLLFTILDPLGQLAKTRDSERKSDLEQLQRALEAYYNDNGSYPSSSTTTPTYRIVRLDSSIADWGQPWTPYVNTLPQDPTSPTRNYVYYSTVQAYYLYANLERGSQDPQACSGGSTCTNVPAGVYCGASSSYPCNYGVSSPNVNP